MTDCTYCIHAKWDRTETGRLHPSGDGRCTYMVVIHQLPVSMYWIGPAPSPSGGWISRHKTFSDDCLYFAREREP